ncbi:hypothetical protein SOVF_049450 [Spinacia oleracea]|nr:hypothetical protein SOVF_049450 [Spinacia oleracea]
MPLHLNSSEFLTPHHFCRKSILQGKERRFLILPELTW